MNKLVILITALVLFSCNKEQGYTIKIDISDLAGSQLSLSKYKDGNVVKIDSVILDSEGTGTMNGSVDSEEIVALGADEKQMLKQFFLGNYTYSINQKDSLDGTSENIIIKASGGPQVDYDEYLDDVTNISEQQQEIGNKYRAASDAQVDEDSLKKIVDSYYALEDQKEAIDSIFILNHPASVVSAYLLRSNYYKYTIDQLEEKLALLDSSLHTTVYFTLMADHLDKMKNVQIGNPYIDFELPDTSGNPLKLSDLAGKGVLMIDFWASWCGPCRRANPDVVEIYNEYNKKGFNILGVSLDREKENWVKAIEDDGLEWHHVSDLLFWQSAAADLYAVSSIPHTVLLDKEGIIVARNLSKEELKSKIEELLAE